MNYDASYLSKIRSGKRKPADVERFVYQFCSYVAQQYTDSQSIELLANYLQVEDEELASSEDCAGRLYEHILGGSEYLGTPNVTGFVKRIDEMDFNDFLRSIKYDEIKIPSIPFSFPTTKDYYGTEQMKDGELDFIKTTVVNKSMDPVYMYSDMDMTDMLDEEFPKKWMFGLAVMVKKGLHLHIIHNLNRPMEEMMLGLEAWLPVYMTGQVTPYYFKGVHNRVFCHFNNVSGAAALVGECIQGHHDQGRYHLTKSRDEIRYYKKKAQYMLEKAKPLMDIYRSDRKESFFDLLKAFYVESKEIRVISAMLPIYTMSEELLVRMMTRAAWEQEEQDRILAGYRRIKAEFETVNARIEVNAQILEVTEEEFRSHPLSVSLNFIFVEKRLTYTYEEYREHWNLTMEYGKQRPKYIVETNADIGFRNIELTIRDNQAVILSKNMSPVIHFVIHHPRLVEALARLDQPLLVES